MAITRKMMASDKEILQNFLTIMRKYYPEKEIGSKDNDVWENGYLGGLVRYLLRKGYGPKFVFIKYLIEYVDYAEVIRTTERFINDLINIEIIEPDPEDKNLYRVTKQGIEVLRKLQFK